jgi:hypothetical protein
MEKGFDSIVDLTRPVASNATDDGKQLNRRVELVRISSETRTDALRASGAFPPTL